MLAKILSVANVESGAVQQRVILDLECNESLLQVFRCYVMVCSIEFGRRIDMQLRVLMSKTEESRLCWDEERTNKRGSYLSPQKIY